MKKFFASVLAVSMAVTGLHVTSYASGDTPMVSIEAQKSNPYMSEIDKELKDFFAKYNAETNSEKKDELLDTAINEVQSKIDSHAHFLNVVSDSAQREEIENKFAALKLKHSILSTVKAKEHEKQTAIAQKEDEKRSALKAKDSELRAKEREAQAALDKKDSELRAKEREAQAALDKKDSELMDKDREMQFTLYKKEEENNLKIKKLNEKAKVYADASFWGGTIIGAAVTGFAFCLGLLNLRT